MKKLLNIRIPNSIYGDLKALSIKQGDTLTDIVTIAITEYLKSVDNGKN